MADKSKLTLALYEIGAIKFGEFKLKSGIISPIYLDLRVLVSHPRVLREVAVSMSHVLGGLPFDRLAAIPYAALPIGTAVALEMDRPLIYPRREKKDYGTGRVVEGEFKPGETAIVLDDVITTGASKIESIEPLVSAGLRVKDIVVLIDREQGGASELAARGYTVHSVIGISEMLRILQSSGKITDDQHQRVLAILQGKP